MKTTKDEILYTALHLFAQRGFDAVSTDMIARQLGLTKGALYRHFESKQAIFDAIWEKMVELDAQRAREDAVPEKHYEDDPESYRNTQLHDLCSFVNNQFLFWTQDGFARDFRRMVTLEQFKSPEMTELYQNVICAGPVKYTEDLMNQMIKDGKLNEQAKAMGARSLAMLLFAPLFLAISLYDGGMDVNTIGAQLAKITQKFEEQWVC